MLPWIGNPSVSHAHYSPEVQAQVEKFSSLLDQHLGNTAWTYKSSWTYNMFDAHMIWKDLIWMREKETGHRMYLNESEYKKARLRMKEAQKQAKAAPKED